MTTLFDAIETTDAGQVWQLCQNGAELSLIDESTGLTALAHAAETGQIEIVRTLLDAGADPDLGGVTTPLEAAVVEGHAEVAQILIGAGADVNRAVEDGFTPLMTAAATGDLLLVEVLLKAGARPRKTNDEGQTAISLAKEAGHSTIVTLLRNSRRRKSAAKTSTAGAKTSPRKTAGAKSTDGDVTDAGEAPQVAEAAAPEAETAEVSPAATDDSSEVDTAKTDTPDSDAATAEDGSDGPSPESSTAAAAAADGDAEATADAAEAPRDDAASEPRQHRGARRDGEPGSDRQEPPTVAPVEDLEAKVEAMAELAEKGKVAPLGKQVAAFEAGLEARDPEGRTLLMLASRRGDVELVFWLLDQGADVEAIDQPRVGHTVLVHATQSLSPDRDKIIRRLVEAGADINRPCGQRRRTPVMHAAEADVYLDRVEGPVFGNSTKTLILLGARLETKDARGNTVWQLIKKDAIGAPTYGASRRRLHQMLRVLEHGGAQPIASHAV